MKVLIILSILFNTCVAFSHYKFKNIKSCPFASKQGCKTVNNKKVSKKNILITYPPNKVDKNVYKPKQVDWASVISGCHSACNFDKRLCNFYIRASAHDSLSISEGYGGTDGSMLITEEELNRPENNYDNFGFILAKNALALAKRFDASVADVISVCGAYSVKYLGGYDIIGSSTKQYPFLVGRIDSNIPNPANQLVPDDANTNDFNSFAIKYGFTIEEFTALLGSHVLLDEKQCLNKDNTYCNPLIEKCTQLSMFIWDNSYYYDLCDLNLSFQNNNKPDDIEISKEQILQNELCKFTSKFFQDKARDDVFKELNTNDNIIIETDPIKKINFVVDNNGVYRQWNYTINDGWLGMACQSKLDNNDINNNIKNSMTAFKNINYWNSVYERAYKKMINNHVRWFKNRNDGLQINGKECKSGFKWVKGLKLCKTAFHPDDSFYY